MSVRLILHGNPSAPRPAHWLRGDGFYHPAKYTQRKHRRLHGGRWSKR